MDFLHIYESTYTTTHRIYRVSISAKDLPNICVKVKQAFEDLLKGYPGGIESSWQITIRGYLGDVHSDSYDFTCIHKLSPLVTDYIGCISEKMNHFLLRIFSVTINSNLLKSYTQ